MYGTHTRVLLEIDSVDYRCSEGHPTVCVHPAFHSGLPDLAAAFARLDDKVAGTPLEFDRIEQQPFKVLSPSPSETKAFSVQDLGSGYVTEAVDSYVSHSTQSYSPGCTLPDNREDQAAVSEARIAAGLNDVVLAWLTDTAVPEGSKRKVSHSADQFHDRSAAEKRTWLAEHYRQLRDCQLTPDDFDEAST